MVDRILNDVCGDEERGRLVGPLVWEVIGTNEPQHIEKRVSLCVSFAMEMALHAAHAAYADAHAAAAHGFAAGVGGGAYKRRLADFIQELCDVGKEARASVEQVRSLKDLVHVESPDGAWR